MQSGWWALERPLEGGCSSVAAWLISQGWTFFSPQRKLFTFVHWTLKCNLQSWLNIQSGGAVLDLEVLSSFSVKTATLRVSRKLEILISDFQEEWNFQTQVLFRHLRHVLLGFLPFNRNDIDTIKQRHELKNEFDCGSNVCVCPASKIWVLHAHFSWFYIELKSGINVRLSTTLIQCVNHVAIWDDKKSSVSELITAAVDETKFFFWGITWIQVFCVWVRMGDWH